MAEEVRNAAQMLLQNPYRQVMLQDYNKTLENRKFRKKLEEIENELGWFNGKKNQYRVEDRQGFFNNYQEKYAGRKHGPVGPLYRSIVTYTFGEEPMLIYFMMLFVKRDEQLKEFTAEHPDSSELKSNDVLRIRYQKLRNEYRLLGALLAQVDKAVGAVLVTISEVFLTDMTSNLDKLNVPMLTNRFFRSLRRQDTSAPFTILEALKKHSAPDTQYMELLAHYNARNFDQIVELVPAFPKEDKNYQPVLVLRAEAQAKRGDIQGFIEAFKEVDADIVDTVHFLYLLQELITHADYAQLDTDEFDASVQELLKSKFKQSDNSPFTGAVSRNFVNYLIEGLPITEELLAIRREKGEDALPQSRLYRLYQLQMALDLYPNEEISSLIDLDETEAKGLDYSRERIGRLAVALLLEKSTESSFENVFLAFNALAKMRLTGAFVTNVEGNLKELVQYGRSGQTRAFDLIKAAYQMKKAAGGDIAELEKVLEEYQVEH